MMFLTAKSTMRNIVAPAALVLSMSLSAFSAHAKVIAGSSEGHAISVDLMMDGRSVDFNLPVRTHGEAPDPYRITRILGGPGSPLATPMRDPLGGPIAGLLRQFTLGGHAMSNVDGGLGNRRARGASGIIGPMPDRDIGPMPNGDIRPERMIPDSFFDIPFDVFSLSRISGDYGDWNMRGGSFISPRLMRLLASIGGGPRLALDGLRPENGMMRLPSFTWENFAGVSGLTLFVNEQWRRCVASECGMWVNALRFNFDGVMLPNGNDIRTLDDDERGLNGDIILGRSAARLVAVPAPATLGLFGLVLMGVTLLRKRRIHQ